MADTAHTDAHGFSNVFWEKMKDPTSWIVGAGAGYAGKRGAKGVKNMFIAPKAASLQDVSDILDKVAYLLDAPEYADKRAGVAVGIAKLLAKAGSWLTRKFGGKVVAESAAKGAAEGVAKGAVKAGAEAAEKGVGAKLFKNPIDWLFGKASPEAIAARDALEKGGEAVVKKPGLWGRTKSFAKGTAGFAAFGAGMDTFADEEGRARDGVAGTFVKHLRNPKLWLTSAVGNAAFHTYGGVHKKVMGHFAKKPGMVGKTADFLRNTRAGRIIDPTSVMSIGSIGAGIAGIPTPANLAFEAGDPDSKLYSGLKGKFWEPNKKYKSPINEG